MAGNFRGVLIFVIFVVDLAVTKINDTYLDRGAHLQGLAVGTVNRMTDRPAEQDTRSYSHVSGAKYELMRIDKNRTDVYHYHRYGLSMSLL